MTLDCPSDCPYLRQARDHERPRELSEMEPSSLFPQVTIPEDLPYKREPLLVGLSYTLAQQARRARQLNDRDLVAALTALAKKYETLVGSGLVYESSSANPTERGIASELEKQVAGYREIEQRQLGYSTLRDSEVLQAIVFMLRLALGRTNGRPRSRAFIDFLFAQFPQKEGLIATAEDSGSRLIVP